MQLTRAQAEEFKRKGWLREVEGGRLIWEWNHPGPKSKKFVESLRKPLTNDVGVHFRVGFSRSLGAHLNFYGGGWRGRWARINVQALSHRWRSSESKTGWRHEYMVRGEFMVRIVRDPKGTEYAPLPPFLRDADVWVRVLPDNGARPPGFDAEGRGWTEARRLGTHG